MQTWQLLQTKESNKNKILHLFRKTQRSGWAPFLPKKKPKNQSFSSYRRRTKLFDVRVDDDAKKCTKSVSHNFNENSNFYSTISVHLFLLPKTDNFFHQIQQTLRSFFPKFYTNGLFLSAKFNKHN